MMLAASCFGAGAGALINLEEIMNISQVPVGFGLEPFGIC